MPFGLHKGVRMQDVPAQYFHWLWVNGMRDRKPSASFAPGNVVADYTRRNLDALKQEHKDGIW